MGSLFSTASDSIEPVGCLSDPAGCLSDEETDFSAASISRSAAAFAASADCRAARALLTYFSAVLGFTGPSFLLGSRISIVSISITSLGGGSFEEHPINHILELRKQIIKTAFV